MILKMKRGNSWLYIDNILELKTETGNSVGANGEYVITFLYSRWHKTGVIAEACIDCNDVVYLLNDEGKTIEVFEKDMDFLTKLSQEIAKKFPKIVVESLI